MPDQGRAGEEAEVTNGTTLQYDPVRALDMLGRDALELEFLERHAGELAELADYADRRASDQRHRVQRLKERLIADGVIDDDYSLPTSGGPHG